MGANRHIDQILTDELLRYSQVWEDHQLLEDAFCIGPTDNILSICSAGSNALALLLCEPASITAVDLNPTQTALLHLKVAGIGQLFYDEFIVLMGARTGQCRWGLYQSIRHQLPLFAQRYWDANRSLIESGILGGGKLERYFDGLREHVIAPLVDQDELRAFMNTSEPSERESRFEQVFGSSEFASRFRNYTGRAKVQSTGRDPAQFKFVELEDTGAFFYERFKHICLHSKTQSNFYLEYFLTSDYADLSVGPPFLRLENFLKLRTLLPRLSIVTGGVDACIEDHPRGHFSRANLSDIFEYLSEEETEALMRLLASHMRVGGRLAYWNHLVSRSCPGSLSALLTPQTELSRTLYAADRVFSYRGFHVDQVASA